MFVALELVLVLADELVIVVVAVVVELGMLERSMLEMERLLVVVAAVSRHMEPLSLLELAVVSALESDAELVLELAD